MQRSRRRVTYSAASLLSPSNTTLQTRKRSRTSSAGGDCADVTKKPKTSPNVSNPKGKSRAAKNAARPAPRNAKAAKGKSKRTADSFQNTIVLAPFYTLKKNFQSKLMDLYSREKVKKVNHKLKMAKKQNMTFAYDVLELKGIDKNDSKKTQKKKIKKEIQQQNAKCGSLSYCKCPGKSPKAQITDAKAPKPKLRNLRSSTAGEPSLSVGETAAKKRKLDDKVLASTMYADLGLSFADNSFRPSESNASLSDISSQSRPDSWETLSDSPAGECIKGSLTLSTTSFDSCLEAPKKRKTRYRTRLKVVKEGQKDNETSFLMKPKTDKSKHGIGGEGAKASDGQIVDFMDREPQTGMLSPTGTSEHLQPLRGHRRQAKKKPKESDAPKVYRLRSAKSMQDNALILTVLDSERQVDELPSPTEEITEPQEDAKHYHVVVETQIETSLSKDTQAPDSPKEQTQQQVDVSKPEESDLKMKETTSESLTKVDSTETIEIFHCGKEKENSIENVDAKPSETVEKEDTGQTEEFLKEPELPVEQQKTQQQTSLQSGVFQPQDNVSDFIFGTGDSTARLGESCEFSFGLNWNFSDEEDSDQGDHFF